MAYSLTDASALGLDLARTPGGVEAAGVLLRALLPVPARPVALRSPAGLTDARRRALQVLGPTTPTVVDLTAAGAPEGTDRLDPGDPEALPVALARLRRRLGAVSFGTVADLLHLARTLPPAADVAAGGPWSLDGLRLDPAEEHPPGEVLGDAVLAALLGVRAHPAAPVLARALGSRLAQQLTDDDPLPAPGRALLVGAEGSGVARGAAGLLARLAVADPASLLLAHRPVPTVWAQRMHEAAWAVETTGRTRLAAAAQLDLVRCLAAAGVSEAAHLGGVWNACSAAVQAHVVADVLHADAWTVLAADLLDALDPPEGGPGLNSGAGVPITDP